MEIRYITQEDDPLEISDIYESSWKYAYKGIIPQDYLDRIPKGQWAGSVHKAGMNSLVLIEERGRIIKRRGAQADKKALTVSFCQDAKWETYTLLKMRRRVGRR